MKKLSSLLTVFAVTTFFAVSFTGCELFSGDDSVVPVVCEPQTKNCNEIDEAFTNGSIEFDICTNAVDTAYLDYNEKTYECDGVDVEAGDCDTAMVDMAIDASVYCASQNIK